MSNMVSIYGSMRTKWQSYCKHPLYSFTEKAEIMMRLSSEQYNVD